MTERKEVVLSERNRQLLESICASRDSEKEAQDDPNFVLEVLLTQIDEEKDEVSACLSPILTETLEPDCLEYYRDELAKEKAA